jgi:HEAT repeat protein
MDIAKVVSRLKSPDAATRADAAELLCHLEAEAQGAAVDLINATADADDSVRQWATAALESLGPPASADRDKIAAALASPKLDIAYWSAMLLGRLESAAAAAVPNLIAALTSHPEPAVREQSAWALGKVGPAASAALPALRTATADAPPRLARLVKTAIEQISATL